MKIFSIVGYSNSGKTYLAEKISDALKGEVGVIKHIHHFDKKGKDTDRLIKKSDCVVAAAENKTYTIKKSDNSLNDSINELLGLVDYAIVEGFKDSELPKIALGEEVVEECEGNSFLVLEEKPSFPKCKEKIFDFIEKESVEKKSYREIIRKMKKDPDIKKAGAIGSFRGIVRGYREEKEVKKLVFEKYKEKFDDEISKITEKLESREGIVDARIYHREGELEVGEDIIYVVVAAEHREELFEALESGINLVKKNAPIWKKEVLVDEENWVHDI